MIILFVGMSEDVDRQWYTHTSNYYFPKDDQYPDMKTAKLVLVVGSFSKSPISPLHVIPIHQLRFYFLFRYCYSRMFVNTFTVPTWGADKTSTGITKSVTNYY